MFKNVSSNVNKLANVMARFDNQMVTLTINKNIEEESYIDKFEVSNRADTIVVRDREIDKTILTINKSDVKVIHISDFEDWFVEFEASGLNYIMAI